MGKMAVGIKGPVMTHFNGEWLGGDPPVIAAGDHSFWLGSTVFDGARSLGGYCPDLDLHCERVVRSARIMGMSPNLTGPEIVSIAEEGVALFDRDAELYICPKFYALEGFIAPDPEATRFVMTITQSPMPEPTGFSACKVTYRRPRPDTAPTEAKAACLYPNVGLGVRQAQGRGYDMGVVLDTEDHVAEFSYTNLFLVKNGVVHTPVINGHFLNGITRQRVIQLLTDAGVEVIERSIDFEEVLDADELFATGNYAKVLPCIKIEERILQPGPVYKQARELYFDFAYNPEK